MTLKEIGEQLKVLGIKAEKEGDHYTVFQKLYNGYKVINLFDRDGKVCINTTITMSDHVSPNELKEFLEEAT